MTLRWTRLAAADLRSSLVWIAECNPKAATKVAARNRSAAETLARHPEIGRPGKIEGTRETLCLPYP